MLVSLFWMTLTAATVSGISPYKKEFVNGAWVISRDWGLTPRYSVLPNIFLGLSGVSGEGNCEGCFQNR